MRSIVLAGMLRAVTVPLLEEVYNEKKILRCYAKSCETGSLQQERKEKRALPREKTSWAVLDEHSRSKRQKDVEGAEKRQTKEGDGGYNYGSTRPSIKK